MQVDPEVRPIRDLSWPQFTGREIRALARKENQPLLRLSTSAWQYLALSGSTAATRQVPGVGQKRHRLLLNSVLFTVQHLTITFREKSYLWKPLWRLSQDKGARGREVSY